MKISALFVLLAVAAAGGSESQGLGGQATGEPSGAFLSGRVLLDAPSEVPVRRATVVLTDVGNRFERLMSADDAGRFVFGNLPAGTYTLGASRVGYLSTKFGASSPQMPGRAVRLSANGHISGIVLRMVPGGVIAGHLFGPSGEPARQTGVRAMRLITVNGERRATYAGQYADPRTDHTGAFRVFGLPPGEYVVVANAQNSERDRLRSVTDKEFESAKTGSAQNQEATQSPATVGYAAVYYPGTTTPAAAEVIKLGKAEVRTDVDFRLQLIPTSAISGRLLDQGGNPVGNASVSIATRAQSPLPTTATSLGTRTVSSSADGRFNFGGVPPGQYRIAAEINRPAGNGNEASNRTAGASASKLMWAVADADVAGLDLDLPLTLQAAFRVVGRVSLDGRPDAAHPDLSRAGLLLTSKGRESGFSQAPKTVALAADGSFVLEDVAPGRYEIKVNWAAAVRDSDWMVKSTISDGVEVADAGLVVRPGVGPIAVDVALTNKLTELAGTVLDASGQPAAEHFLLVFPEDERFWTLGPRRMRGPVRLERNGKFLIKGLPPGNYFLGLVTEVDADWLTDYEFLSQIAEVAVKVALREGARTEQDLHVSGGTDVHLGDGHVKQ